MGPNLEGANPVYGSSRAAWSLNGRYFNRDGKEISAAEAALPDPADPPVPVEPAPVEEELPSFRYTDTPPVVKAEPVVDEPAKRPATYKLRKMNAAQIAALVKLAGGKPEKGFGSKRKNIEWLLEHTE